MPKKSATFVLALGFLLAGCMTPAEEESYYRERCQYHYVTFEKLEPGTPEHEHCMEQFRSGMGGYENDIHGGTGLGIFAD